MVTKLNIEGTPIRVQEARRMLTNWNKLVKGETIKGVSRMKASDIDKVLEDFTIKKGIVKHKTKAKGWSFNPATLEAKTGKMTTTIPKYQAKKKMKKEEMPKTKMKKEEMPKTKVKKGKMTDEERKEMTRRIRLERSALKRRVKKMMNSQTEDSNDKPVYLSKENVEPIGSDPLRLYKKKKKGVIL